MSLPMDYHLHSRFSPDSGSEPEEVCRKAIEIGVQEICFTDHFDLNSFEAARYTFDLAGYQQEIKRCQELFRPELKVRLGLEIGEPHLYQQGLANALKGLKFDYLLGSIHWIGDTLIGPEYLSQREFATACREYLELVYATAKVGPYHCIGHLDMVKRHSTAFYGRKFVYEEFREEVDQILSALVEFGRGLEVNTSGWRQGVGEPYPGIVVLKRYRQMGGEIITLGSDSHRLEPQGAGLTEGLAMIKAAGFAAVTTFCQGKPVWVDI